MTDTENDQRVEFLKNPKALRKLATVTTLLTLMTLGIYRFWARTRLRKHFWSAVRLDGHGFEYTGRGLEKLLGFLIAVAFLAVYLGIFQLILSFAGMSLLTNFESDGPASLGFSIAPIAFIIVAPLIYFAQYRARRYMLSRTLWKGIRFGADQAAWAYSFRVIMHSLISIITLGILLPRQTFYLEKFKTDRTWFGSWYFKQGGKWTMLYPAMVHFLIPILILVVAIGLSVVLLGQSTLEQLEASEFFDIAAEKQLVLGLVALMSIVAVIWFYIGVIYYNINSYRILAGAKTLGDKVRFSSEPRTGGIIGIYVGGSLLVGFIASILASLAIGFFALIIDVWQLDFSNAIEPEVIWVAGIFAFYFLMFVTGSILSIIFIKQPIIRHYAMQTVIYNLDALSDVTQREGSEVVEAEGFADALDVGGGF